LFPNPIEFRVRAMHNPFDMLVFAKVVELKSFSLTPPPQAQPDRAGATPPIPIVHGSQQK
jgi:hypothetical protein